MQRQELRDAGRLLGTALGELAELSRDVHRGVAGRVFGLLGTPAAPVRLMHDAIAGVAYGSTRLGTRVLPAAVGASAAAARRADTGPFADAARAHVALAALDGFWGDRTAEDAAALSRPMRLRTHGGPLRARPANVAHDAGAAATGRLAVFVHGLCESDRCWWLRARGSTDRDVTFGSRLRDDHGWTPIYADFNSGLHISANGRELAEKVDALVRAWPVPVTEVALVGHSMGGLVARAAAERAALEQLPWSAALRHVIGLGTPHLGAPLERAVNAGTSALARLPETRPFATWLNRRSVGIKDLRYGALVEADWLGHDPDERLVDRCTAAALLPGVTYSMVSATLSRRPDGLFGHDLLVQHVSAHGTGTPRSRRIEFDADRLFHVGGRHHFDLLRDPAVYEKLSDWLG